MPRAIPPGYLSVDQAVAETGVARRTLFRWIAEHRLRAYRFGGIRPTLLKRDELERELGPQERS